MIAVICSQRSRWSTRRRRLIQRERDRQRRSAVGGRHGRRTSFLHRRYELGDLAEEAIVSLCAQDCRSLEFASNERILRSQKQRSCGPINLGAPPFRQRIRRDMLDKRGRDAPFEGERRDHHVLDIGLVRRGCGTGIDLCDFSSKQPAKSIQSMNAVVQTKHRHRQFRGAKSKPASFHPQK